MKDHHHHQLSKQVSTGSNSKTVKNQNSSSKNLRIDFREKKGSAHVETSSQLSRSTKNLYGIISKEKLLDEINGVNEALSKIQDTKKKAGLQILEETLN